ncbi:MAG TPA: hypothetical protein PKC54_10565 [Ferruginibacter sp.]|nr:hypothetical protein [Ferruginibacter sp.]
MERVETLLKKLQDQFVQNASPEQLLLTVQMLQAELFLLQGSHGHAMITNDVAITVSGMMNPVNQPGNNNHHVEMEIKTVEVLQVDEAEIEAELEEIRRNAEEMQKISIQNKPHIMMDSEDDIPTLTHQQQKQEVRPDESKREINETVAVNATASINERLKQSKIDLGETLTEVPIRDLRKAIGVNDRFLFINELFRGDEPAYERSIKTINGFSIFPEAEYWIQRELKVKNGWSDANEIVQQFYHLVKRRFS